MDIDNIKIYNLKIPFSRKIKHSLHTRSETESIIIVLQDHNGNKGIGEGTPREYVTGETLTKCLTSAKLLVQEILRKSNGSINELDPLLNDIGESDIANESPAAFCAVETALLDLWSRVEKKTLYELFANKRNTNFLSCSGVIPFLNNDTDLLKYIEIVKKLRLTALKMKVVDIDSGISQLRLARKNLGSGMDIRVDANSAFNAETAIDFIKRAKPIHISALEQPVAKNDLTGLKKVSENSEIPIIADESMYTSKGPSYLIENNICHGLNIRLSSCGGFRKAYKIYQHAILKHMTVVVGSHVGETAILSFAGRNLAMMCPETRYLEGSFSKYVLQEDLVNSDISFGAEGLAPVPNTLGLGIEILNSLIEKWSDLYALIAQSGKYKSDGSPVLKRRPKNVKYMSI